MDLSEPIPLSEIRAARDRLAGSALHTPLLSWNGTAPDDRRIHLKLECLQPIGSFKLRGAGNAMLSLDREALREGVWTASAGNMAQGVAWWARRLKVPCTTVVPENAPETKLAAIRRLDAEILKVPFADWWNILLTSRFEACRGAFIHPVCNAHVMAGNGTIGLEILEDLPDVDTVLVPYGGGGLSCGIASAMRAIKPAAHVLACEPQPAAPFAAAFAAGHPVDISYTPSFIDGCGGRSLMPDMWPIARATLSGAVTVTVSEAADAIRLLLERHHVVAEGAGALPLAAALRQEPFGRNLVCVISGGNLDPSKLVQILNREL